MNEIISAGRRLAISSDRAPQDLDGIEPRILSRLSWGLVADINAADLELRLSIIQKKLEQLPDVSVPEDVVMFLAKRISSNVRELEGALNRIAAYATMQSRPIDLDFVGEVLANILRANQRRISIDEIQTRVSDHYRIRKAEMTSARRAREVARAAPGGDVPLEAAHPALAARDRPALRRARPYDGDFTPSARSRSSAPWTRNSTPTSACSPASSRAEREEGGIGDSLRDCPLFAG